MSTMPPPPQTFATANGDVPLSQPLYGASFGQAVTRFFKKYATFSGRASRSEFWWWSLANVLFYAALLLITVPLGMVGATVDPVTGTKEGVGLTIANSLSMIWLVGSVVPTLALIWRRLHDANMSGGWAFMYFIPVIGTFILFGYMFFRSKPEGARFDARR